MPKTSTSFKPDNEAAVTHGMRSYLTRTDEALDESKPITLAMSAIEKSVLDDLRANGPRGIIEASVTRFETASQILWAYMQRGEKEFRDSIRWWSYVQANAQRAARDLAAMPTPDNDHGDVLAAYKVTDHDHTSE